MEYVTVSPEWLARAKEYGTQRESLNGGNNTPAYAHNGVLPYSSLTASRLAVVAEIGAHLYFGVDPSTTQYVVDRTAANYEVLRASADLTVAGRKIEVRNAAVTTSPLPIKTKDVAANAIVVQTHVEMADGRPTGKVYFLGWHDAVKGWDAGMKRNNTSYRSVKKPMDTLNDVLGVKA